MAFNDEWFSKDGSSIDCSWRQEATTSRKKKRSHMSLPFCETLPILEVLILYARA